MNKTKPYVYKRVIAYIIDLLVVTLVAGVLSLVLVNNKAYDEDVTKMNELLKDFTEEKIEEKSYLAELEDLNYSMTVHSKGVTIITFVVALGYFGVLSYFCNGITLGKYIVKIKVASANGKKLQIWNYLLRSLIINLVLINIVNVLLVSTLSKETFMAYYSKISNLNSIILLVSFILIMYRDDGRGIEDFMGNTKVINIKDEIQEDTEEIKDATIISEKKNKKKEVK